MSETTRALKSLRSALVSISRELATLKTNDYSKHLEILKKLTIIIEQLDQVIDQLED